MKSTVVLATYNGSRFIGEQLESIVNQTRKPDRVIIADDRSTDGTPEICREILEKSGIDYEIRINPKQMGAARNFMRLAAEADGDVIFFCDQDDIWDTDKIRRTMIPFEENKDCTMAFCDADVWYPEQPVTQTMNEFIGFDTGIPKGGEGFLDMDRFWNQLINRSLINGMNMAIRADIAAQQAESLMMLHDAWFTLQAAAMGKIYCINAPLAKYRQHSANVSGADGRLTKKKMSNSRQKVLKSFEGTQERIRIIRELDEKHHMLNKENREKLKAYAAYEEKREQAITRHRGIAYLTNERKYKGYGFSSSKKLMIRDLMVTMSR